MNFVPSANKAKEWKISQRRVAILCKEGRVQGAELIGNRWFMPADAEKPADPRRVKKSE
ncbi:MAG: DNA-binding protein [Lachnospiraceae bacterium]|nr:DNA-binding protein [Lachnospiraceae bacterium]